MPDPIHGAVEAVQSMFATVQRRVRGLGQSHEGSADRWLVVTVDRSMAEVVPGGQLPSLLAEFADSIEVDPRPAPGNRGTELAVRPTGRPVPGVTGADDETPEQLRRTLRKVKQLIEVGEVLIAEPRPHGRRPSTPGGKLVDAAERKADRGGVL